MSEDRILRWSDPAMYPAAPLAGSGEEVRPTVEVITMTPDPLRVMAAVNEMYRGNPCSADQVTREMAMAFAADCLKSKIAAPLEWCEVALLISGVSRDFTHQMVRQRTATYAQESMRFAVKDNAANEVPTPPSIAEMREDDPIRVVWQRHVQQTALVYDMLVNSGRVPAEDARKGLLIGTATRLHYRTNLRDLIQHSGLRLCSQAQREWKVVWIEIIKAILNYGPADGRWQQREIVRLFRPICYQTGKCEFMGFADRYCSIRERVEVHHRNGDRPEDWDDIDPHEPLHRLSATDPGI